MSGNKLPKGVEKLPKGVEINGQRLRISFYYLGRRCKEPLPAGSTITKQSIIYADNKRRTILSEIKEGRFDYAAHFPESALAPVFSGTGGPNSNRTVAEGVKIWLEVMDAKKAASTSRNYRSKSKHVIAWAGSRRIADVSKSDIELFQARMLKEGLKPKTVNDVFTVVRGVWADAFSDGVLKSNPLERVENIERDNDEDHADPFSREELEQIARVKTSREQDVNMILFNSWAGLSVSELVAVGWDDVDWEAGVLWVRRARVQSQYKVPKEKARVRAVELIDPAMEYLRKQKEFTEKLPGVTVEVTQRDNVTVKRETVRFIFRNSASGEPWYPYSLGRWLKGHLKRAGVRHRGPNQCRHTFASQAISSYVPLEWVARQLGHTDTTMVKKHYGRWIPTDTKSMAGMVSEMMGVRTRPEQA
ncbi:Arm DNA-binding domain-containing protein [Metapseudomonas otitidis]|uniref:Arm DNA-binding domain-containing protein n=1 Tax=Metapseudomonas otitidis TaxID=319939 RepID=UPI002446B2F8|nr:DUF3596 domain-containing protein [Pseudomonas otitidis]MDG9784944.1 site-specific integrase [Pseudomonas otitidis]